MAHRVDREFALAGLGAHLGLSLGHALIYDAPLAGADGGYDVAAAPALALVAAGCLVSARLHERRGLDRGARLALDGIGLAVVAYLASVDARRTGAHARVGRRGRGARRARTPAATTTSRSRARSASSSSPGCMRVTVVRADGVARVAASRTRWARWRCSPSPARRWPRSLPGVDRLALQATAAVTVLYLASVEVITVFQPADADLPGTLGVRQQGQALLSGLWALVGVGDARRRACSAIAASCAIGALALLAVTLAKVGLYDLASLDSLYRVASFVALGALLLLGAFAWQRLRPAAPPDLRDVPPAIR